MKRLQAAGIGSAQRKAEPISFDEEELLWQKGILGAGSPQSLVNTMFYMNGLYFALRGGNKHRNLRHQPLQIELVEKPGERPYLVYREDISKSHPGGLKGRKVKPKVVVHHANIDKPERCFLSACTSCTTTSVHLTGQMMHTTCSHFRTLSQTIGIPLDQ